MMYFKKKILLTVLLVSNCFNAMIYFLSLAKRRGFEFNLSFQQGYGIYKISHDNHHSDGSNSISYHSLLNCDCENTKETQKDSSQMEFSTISVVDSSTCKNVAGCKKLDSTDARKDLSRDKFIDSLLSEKMTYKKEEIRNIEKGTFFEGPERRLSHEEGRKPELSDWEWCRSKSERTPRQVACNLVLNFFMSKVHNLMPLSDL